MRAAQVIGEDQEGRAAGAEEAVVGDAIADRAHGVLADAEPDVAAERVGFGEIAAVLEVVLGGAEEVGAAGDELRHGLGDRVEHRAAGGAGGVLVIGGEGRDLLAQIGGHGFGQAVGEFGRELRDWPRPRRRRSVCQASKAALDAAFFAAKNAWVSAET